MLLGKLSAANGGKAMGGFATPPGGWDPRMEAMFTTGAFEPVTASEQDVLDYQNKPPTQLPKLPYSNSSSSAPQAPSQSRPWTGGAPYSAAPTTKPNPNFVTYQDMLKKLGVR